MLIGTKVQRCIGHYAQDACAVSPAKEEGQSCSKLTGASQSLKACAGANTEMAHIKGWPLQVFLSNAQREHGEFGSKMPEKASGALLLHDVQQSFANASASHAASLQDKASLYELAMRAPFERILKHCIECRQSAVLFGRGRSPGTGFSHAPMEQP